METIALVFTYVLRYRCCQLNERNPVNGSAANKNCAIITAVPHRLQNVNDSIVT